MHCGFVDSSLSYIRYLDISAAYICFYIDCKERNTPNIFAEFWESHITVEFFFRQSSGRIVILTKPFLFNANLYPTVIHTHWHWSLMKWWLFRIVFPVVKISCNVPLSPSYSDIIIGLHLLDMEVQSKFLSHCYMLYTTELISKPKCQKSSIIKRKFLLWPVWFGRTM